MNPLRRSYWIMLVIMRIMILKVVGSVQITKLSVPSVVLNGSLPSIVLDCIYELETPNSSASGLVVKWYHNRGHSPVYQWIPGYPPQAFGVLRDHVNLHYVASDDPLMRHRAVQLLQPRPELSGEFTCKVTTWANVAVSTKRMTIYAPVTAMALSSTEPRSHQVTVTCQAEGMYPEPEVSLLVQRSRRTRDLLRGLKVTKALVNGAYSIRVTKELDDREIPAQCLIHCQLTLPHTTYSVEEKIPHIRGSASYSSLPVVGRRYPYQSLSHTMAGVSAAIASYNTLYVTVFSLLISLLVQR